MNQLKLLELKNKASQLPLEPGVYLMRDNKGQIIYIGKAKQLRNRVSSYFRSVDKHLPKVYRMVENVDHFEVIIAGSEFEALVLECSMIKQHTPKYNILLKDDKGYSYVKVTKEDYPRITEVKQRVEDGSSYIGPYMSAWVVNQTIDEANKAFLLPTCQRSFPRDFGKQRPCLNFHMKQCMGVCRGTISREEYQETISSAMDFIKGGTSDTIALLQQKMEQAAEELEFEKAARYRDRINAIQKITDRQRVVYAKVEDQDFLGFVQSSTQTAATIMKFRDKKLVDKLDFLLGETTDIADVRKEFVIRYYTDPTNDTPDTISLDGDITDHELIEQLLSQNRPRKVTITEPKRGELVKLVEMARLNAAQFLSTTAKRSGKELTALDELAKLLGLAKPPSYIEAYDISNISSEVVVGGMVVFEEGRPLKAAYRKFNIKTVQGVDDYGSMAEMLKRRLLRYKDGHVGFDRLPDLMLIDGGAGHVSTVKAVLEELGYAVPVYGMVKDSRHRTRAIAGDGGEISISSSRSAFTLLSNIQNEVHRYAVSFAHQRHKKTAFELALTSIEGVGEGRAAALFKHFKTKKAMAEASQEELAAVKGMTKKAAKAVYCYFRENS